MLVIMCYLFFGCSKTTKEKMPVIQNTLYKDTNFIKVVNLEEALKNHILMLADRKGVTPLVFKKKIQSLHDKDLNSTKNNKLLNEYMGPENVLYLIEYAKVYNKAWSNLNIKYNYISMQNIDDACKQLYAKRYNQISNITSSLSPLTTNSFVTINKVNDCGWRFSVCMAAATAGAILCHVGCIGGTAGLGTPACVVLCGTLEIAAGVACIDNYCPIS